MIAFFLQESGPRFHPHTPCTLRPIFADFRPSGSLLNSGSTVGTVLQFCSVTGLAVSLLRAVRIQCGGWPRTPPQSYAQYTAAFQFKLKRKKKPVGTASSATACRAARARNCRVEGQAAASPKQATSSHQVLNSEFSSIHPDTRSVWCARHKQLNVQRRLAGPR